MSNKNKKNSKRLQLHVEIGERKNESNLSETFKIIKGISNNGRHFFSLFSLGLEIYCQD